MSVYNKVIKVVLANVVAVFLTPTVCVTSPKSVFFSRVEMKGGNGLFGVCGFQDVCVSTRRHGGRLVGRGRVGKLVFGARGSPEVVKDKASKDGRKLN